MILSRTEVGSCSEDEGVSYIHGELYTIPFSLIYYNTTININQSSIHPMGRALHVQHLCSCTSYPKIPLLVFLFFFWFFFLFEFHSFTWKCTKPSGKIKRSPAASVLRNNFSVVSTKPTTSVPYWTHSVSLARGWEWGALIPWGRKDTRALARPSPVRAWKLVEFTRVMLIREPGGIGGSSLSSVLVK